MSLRRHDTRCLATMILAFPFVLGMLSDSTRFRTAKSAEPIGKQPADSSESIDRWISELSSDNYAVRRRAASALIRAGVAAQPALVDAAQSVNLETQLQAERILAIVVENALDKRIAAFENDIDGSGGITLPGWSRAVTRVGGGAESRKLYSKMYRAENALLNEYDLRPKASSKLFEERVRAIREGRSSKATTPIRYRTNRSHPSLRSSLRALLLVGSDPEVPIDTNAVTQFDQLLQQAWPTGDSRSTLTEFGGDTCLSDWIVIRSTTEMLELQHLHLGMVFGVQSTIDLAERVLRKETVSSGHKRIAVLCIARFGNTSHISLLEPLLEDAARVAFNQRIINNERVRVETQLRDIALAALVHITHQKETDYRLIASAVNEPYDYRPNPVFFQNDVDRETALKKWAAWREEHVDQDNR